MAEFIRCKGCEESGGHEGASRGNEGSDLFAGDEVILSIKAPEDNDLRVFLDFESTEDSSTLCAEDIVFVAFSDLGIGADDGE